MPRVRTVLVYGKGSDLEFEPFAAHAVFIDGFLIPVGQLVNGTGIVFELAEGRDTLDFFHIALGRHDVLDAEGAPCESLLDPCGESCVRPRWWSTAASRSISSATDSRSVASCWPVRPRSGPAPSASSSAAPRR